MWKNLSSYLLYLLITVLMVSLYLGDFSGFQKLQWKLDDTLYSFRGEDAHSPDIILVSIDDQAVKAYGEWPWSYSRVADLVAACNAGQPKTILINLDLSARESEDTTGNTNVLANQVSWADKIVLTYDVVPTDYSNQRMSKPPILYKFSLQTDSDLGIMKEDATLNVRKLFLPSGTIAQYASGLGFAFVDTDKDRHVRRVPLVANYEGYYYPSATLMTAALYMGVSPDNIVVRGSRSVKLGQTEIPTDKSGEIFVNFKKPKSAYTEISAADLLQEKFSPAGLKGKLVIIGLGGKAESEYYTTPVAAAMPRTELYANVIDNIIHNGYIKNLNISTGVHLLILVGFGVFCLVILPRVTLLYRAIILFFWLFILANITVIMFNAYGVLIKSLYMGLEILLFLVACPMLETDVKPAGFKFNFGALFKKKIDAQPSRIIDTATAVRGPARRDMQQTSGVPEMQRTDTADRHPATEATDMASTASPQPTTAFNAGTPPSQPVPLTNSNPHLAVPQNADQSPSFGNITPTSMSAPIANQSPFSASPTFGESDRIKNLGRYQVLGVLGKGAMGTVFQGVDPAINRPVALKTIRLDFVTDQEEMNELRDRLFREAQAAGKLSHPNIVTIYDVGAEGNLQYIAMEYLEGQTLESLIRKKVQFSYKIVATMITQICSALQYAHDQGIVHRDIKPANIMVLPNYSIKVMDFGIARVDSSSMTRTGIAMGTPNYISPEQLQGKSVDRRCDLFSLGVVVYELLTGRRPFRGENLTSLIYAIINEDPPAPSTINENVPLIFDHITGKALKKNPMERYQKASDMQMAVVDFVDSFAPPRKVGL